MDSDSDKEAVESEEETQDPYPLEGKYKDEADKRESVNLFIAMLSLHNAHRKLLPHSLLFPRCCVGLFTVMPFH
jgi:hypothetical protein